MLVVLPSKFCVRWALNAITTLAVEEAAVAAVGVAVVVVVVVVVGAEGEDGVATEETSAVVDAVEGDGGEVMAIGVVAVAEATAGLGTIIMVDLMRTGAVVVAVAVVVGDMKEGTVVGKMKSSVLLDTEGCLKYIR
mmetsp:Transcript_20677/g.60106  ORF Transcript_20677/g.60106 Transcript_20677/m.60106 type:complete len:136 (+) Transcript_20677:2624-3031(+)